MSKYSLPKVEILEAVNMAVWVPFTSELQNEYNAFKVNSDNPMFANYDGLFLVKNNNVVEYISENGGFWGTCKFP
jgi:hypothetical protein